MSETDDEQLDREAPDPPGPGSEGSGADALGPEAERVRAALRSVPPLRADAAFRQRLKQDFVSGAIQVTRAKERRPRFGNGKAAALSDRRRRLPAVVWAAASLAAAAALVVVFGALNRGPTWWVTAARGDGSLSVDGQPVDLDDRDAMRRLLVPGAEVEVVGNAELDICSSGVLALQLLPGTRMTLPPPPARWFGRRTELHARAGELRITTGRKFPGVQFAVLSPNAAVEVEATTFAVIIEDAGTCVCVYDGTALVGRLRGGEFTDMQSVPGGMRRYVYNDERPSDIKDMRDEERVKLASFRDSQRPWLEGGGTPD